MQMHADPKENEALKQAAQAVARADALLIGAGAGMGVDSGLPDFRGPQGFWRAYPAYEKLGLNFMDLANPRWFATDPSLAWGFYGHRRNLYRATRPHAGFQMLQNWANRMKHGVFAFTSNVDGHFQKAGFDPERIVEVHGAIDWMQCTRSCGIFAAEPHEVRLDESTMRALEPLPTCPSCGTLARPNILMFGDYRWDETRTAQQHDRLDVWLRVVSGLRLAVIECGAGNAVPTVRHFCEQAAGFDKATLIRINPSEPEAPDGHIGLALGALAALRGIDDHKED